MASRLTNINSTLRAVNKPSDNVHDYGQIYINAWRPCAATSFLGPNSRLTPQMHVVGIRLNVQCESIDPDRIQEFHFAVLQPKKTLDVDGTVDTNDITDRFWRSYLSTDVDQYQSWSSDPGTGAVWRHRLSWGRINGHTHNVLLHKRVFLGPSFAVSGGWGGKSHMYATEKWIKINKRFQFTNAADQLSRNPIYLVMWHTTPSQAYYPATTTQAAHVAHDMTVFSRWISGDS